MTGDFSQIAQHLHRSGYDQIVSWLTVRGDACQALGMAFGSMRVSACPVAFGQLRDLTISLNLGAAL